MFTQPFYYILKSNLNHTLQKNAQKLSTEEFY